jgi:hypothetical protein
MTDRWQSAVDKAIQRAMEEGRMENLPGTGKPLQLDDDPNVPYELRLAHKTLRDNDLAPEWIMMGKDLEKTEAKLRDEARRAVNIYQRAMRDAEQAAPGMAHSYRSNAEKVWDAARRALRESAATYNRQVLAYNLKVPAGVAHRSRIDIDQTIERLLAR